MYISIIPCPFTRVNDAESPPSFVDHLMQVHTHFVRAVPMSGISVLYKRLANSPLQMLRCRRGDANQRIVYQVLYNIPEQIGFPD